MPTDGESLMTLIASCGGSGSNAVASVSAMRDASQTLFVRVGALRRSGKGQGTGGGFTAADAKREGGLLAKIFNTALKQQTALKEGQDEAAKQLLSTAEHALGLLHEMAPHLAFMPTDLDKLSQNLIQKLIDRGLGKRARAQSEAMLVRLAERLCGKKLAAAHAFVDKENACKGNTMAAKQVSGKIEMNDSTSGWRAALMALTETTETSDTILKDDCALVVACLSNLSTFALQQPPPGMRHPVLKICGAGCMRWLQQLAVLDSGYAQRLAGSLYRNTSKAAVLADDLAASPSTCGDTDDDLQAALELRELSLIYLAMSAKVGIMEVVTQLVKTSKFYDSKPAVRGTTLMQAFHSRLLDRLAPVLLQLVNHDKVGEHALALGDWATAFALSQARNFKAPSANTPLKTCARGGARSESVTFARRMSDLLVDLGAGVQEWTGALLGVVSVVEALILLGTALNSSSVSGASLAHARCACEERVAEAVVALQQCVEWAVQAKSAAHAPLTRIIKAVDGVRILSATLLASSSFNHQHLASEVRSCLLLQSELQATAARVVSVGVEGEDMVRRSLDALVVALHSAAIQDMSQEGEGGCAGLEGPEMKALEAFVETTRKQGASEIVQAQAVAATAPLFNVAVAAYNCGRFAEALSPLRITCKACALLLGDVHACMQAEKRVDLAQLAKRHRMLAFCLQRTGESQSAVKSSARAAALLSICGDWSNAKLAVQEAASLRSSMLGADTNNSQITAMTVSTLLDLSELGAALTAEGALLPFLEAELWASLAARNVRVPTLLAVCDKLLAEAPPAMCARSWALRGRILLERAKLVRTRGVSCANSLESRTTAKGKPKSKSVAVDAKAKSKETRNLQAGVGGDAVSTSNEALEALLKAVEAWDTSKGGEELLRTLTAELGCVYTWQAIALLDDSGEGYGGAGRRSGDAMQAGVTALALFSSLATHVRSCRDTQQMVSFAPLTFALSGNEDPGWEVARAQAHVMLLGDVFNLHGQEMLQLRSMEVGAELAEGSEGVVVGANTVGLCLTVECGLAGLSDAAALCLEWSCPKESAGGGKAGREVGAGSLRDCMTLVARAAVLTAQGRGKEATGLLEQEELLSLANERFRRLKDGREELASHYGAVMCEAAVLQGQGLVAVRHAVAAVRALLSATAGPVRVMTAAAATSGYTTTAASSDEGSVSYHSAHEAEERLGEEAAEPAARGESGAVDMGAYGALVCQRSGEVSQFRHLHQVSRALARTGELYAVMGFAREATYYLEQGLQRLVAEEIGDARANMEEASLILNTATHVAQHAADPLTFLAAERFHLHTLSARLHLMAQNADAARAETEAARAALRATRERADVRSKAPQTLTGFLDDVSSITLGVHAWLVPLLVSGARKVGRVAGGPAAPVAKATAKKGEETVDWRVKYGFKQPAHAVKAKQAVGGKSKGSDSKPVSGKQLDGLVGSLARGGMSDESGFDELLAALDFDVLLCEGKTDEAFAVVSQAAATLCPCSRGDDLRRTGWDGLEVQVRMGEALWARVGPADGGEEVGDQVMTDLGRQLCGISLENGVALKGRDAENDDDLDELYACLPLPSEKTLNGMKVAELKRECEARGLVVSGKKADLVARLMSAASTSASPLCDVPTAAKGGKLDKAVENGNAATAAPRTAPLQESDASAEGLEALMMAWQRCHPSGPPLLIRRYARLLARWLRHRDVNAAAYFEAASFAVTARQQMLDTLQVHGALQRQQAGFGPGYDEQRAALEMRVDAREPAAPRPKGKGTGRVSTKSKFTAKDGFEEVGPGAIQQGREWLQSLVHLLPRAWTVVIVSCDAAQGVQGTRQAGLTATRLEHGETVRRVRVDAGGVREGGFGKVLGEFREIMRQSRLGLESGSAAVSTDDKKKWWNQRSALDSQFEAMVSQVERDWLESAGMLPLLVGTGRGAGRGNAREKPRESGEDRCSEHLVLVLDETAQEFPWEALPSLAGRSVSRMPSLPMLLAALHRANLVPDGMGGAAVCADARKCFYVVNPSGDLAHTQATFEAAFRLQPWEGVAGAPPDAQRLLAALRSQDLFAYCGHGAGERYLGGEGGESLRASPLAVSTAAILMGCSSGRLKRIGPLEPRGMALSYLMAGCPMAIGCLWDVSDRDIDRFADFVFRVGGVYVNLPPKVVSDSKGKTSEEACAMTLPLAVARGRESVRMKFLIGAAPVCYGLPVICRWVEEL